MGLVSFLLIIAGSATAANRPNILFLLSDDQDWIETSVQMHPDIPNSKSPHIQTPTLEMLASQGMRFSQAYSPAPVCSPTRISLQTGKSPAQVNWTKAAPGATAEDGYKLISPVLDRQIADSHITIAERLKSVGYATAHYGKWHIRGGGPEAHGYDESDGDTSNGDAAPHMGDNPVDIFGMGERAMAFMENSHNADTPFFIQMSYHALHYPQNARPDTYAKYEALLPNANEKTIGRSALAENLDEGIGLLLNKIDALGIADNTYILYMSDNGGGGNSNARPISGGKGNVKEGGIRVPLIIRGPGIAVNSWSHQAVVGYDFYNTFSVLAGIDSPFPEGIEGGSLVHIFQGIDVPVVRPREGLYFHFPHYQGDTPHSAIILGDYKLLHYYETGEDHLFNLSTDLKESNNLVAQLPEKTEELSQKLTNYLSEINASFPIPNPLYEGNDNEGPVLNSIPDKTIEHGGTLNITCAVTSALPVNFSLTSAPAGATIDDQTGKINWTPNESHAGTIQSFTVQVSDGSRTDSESFNAIVTNTDSGEAALFNLLLGRPKDDSIVISVITEQTRDIYIEYGTEPGSLSNPSSVTTTTAGQPIEVQLAGLTPNTKYYYRLRYADPGNSSFETGTTRSFHTQRSAGASFTFLIEADPHHMDNDPEVWLQALQNMLLDDADFLIDLGDTFMSEKFGSQDPYLLTKAGLDETYEIVRSDYFATATHSLPVFLVDGNHEAELGWILDPDKPHENPAVWASQARQKYFSGPKPDDFYIGAQNIDPYTQAPRDAYYAFYWGDALFIALDPYWYTSPKPNQSSWNWTLGIEQYTWLKDTLESSNARYKFVFAHHLIGGALGVQARGGLTNAHLWEWGGFNEEGIYEFDTYRPGWGKPIQDLLLENGVQVFFHGHDHMYVKEELDADNDGTVDLIYQLVPQPSKKRGGTGAAENYGYTNGPVIGNSGHLRVSITPEQATVEYVRVFLPEDEGNGNTNRIISDSYTILPGEVEEPPFISKTSLTNPVENEPTWITANIYRPQPGSHVTLVYNAGGIGFQLTMFDDGFHGDGIAGDGKFGAQLPAFPANTSIEYYIAATDRFGEPQTEPAGAPGSKNSFTVQSEPGQEPSTSALPDTNQTQSFTNTPGEDSDYSINPPSYTDHGDGTITDTVTGLIWQKNDGGEMTWADASSYADSSTIAGYDDWRLPNSKELFSTFDHSTNNPALNTTYFPQSNPAASYWWTNEHRADGSDRSWAGNVGGGIGPHPHSETISAGGDKRFHVRLVRGSGNATSAAPHSYFVKEDGTILDLDTGLMWQQTEFPSALSWENALQQAEALELGTFTDWRLPNIKELNSINDETRIDPSLDTSIFPSATPDRYWSSTSQNNQTGRAWFVDFRFGIVSQAEKTESYLTRAVRGPVSGIYIQDTTLSISRAENGFTLHCYGNYGEDYELQVSDDLKNWQTLLQVDEAHTPFYWTDSSLNFSSKRFYRLHQLP